MPSRNCQSRIGYSCVPLSAVNGKIPVCPSRPVQPGIAASRTSSTRAWSSVSVGMSALTASAAAIQSSRGCPCHGSGCSRSRASSRASISARQPSVREIDGAGDGVTGTVVGVALAVDGAVEGPGVEIGSGLALGGMAPQAAATSETRTSAAIQRISVRLRPRGSRSTGRHPTGSAGRPRAGGPPSPRRR